MIVRRRGITLIPEPFPPNRTYTSRCIRLSIGKISIIEIHEYESSSANVLVLWALLSKLYPENVVMLESFDAAEVQAARAAGKGVGTRFLIG